MVCQHAKRHMQYLRVCVCVCVCVMSRSAVVIPSNPVQHKDLVLL